MSTIEAVEERYEREVKRAQEELQAVTPGTPVSEVAARLIRELGLSEQAVREAIMDALYEGAWALSSDRRLVTPSRHE